MLLTGCVRSHVSAPFEFSVKSEATPEELRAATELTNDAFDGWRKAQPAEVLSGSPVTRELAVKSLAL